MFNPNCIEDKLISENKHEFIKHYSRRISESFDHHQRQNRNTMFQREWLCHTVPGVMHGAK